MLESNKTPQLSLTPEVADPQLEQAVASIQQQNVQAAPAQEKAPRLDDSQLTPAERQAIDEFEKQLDVSNPDHVLLFGADAR